MIDLPTELADHPTARQAVRIAVEHAATAIARASERLHEPARLHGEAAAKWIAYAAVRAVIEELAELGGGPNLAQAYRPEGVP